MIVCQWDLFGDVMHNIESLIAANIEILSCGKQINNML
ncbi:hypothetical protein M115_2200 [Bacteroides fragilis str. 3719 T6]|nr:hypothetical protein M085_1998 [Bacteroides fragilis str. 3986 N(B)19]EYA48547.1 hypothetical protein M115_2200 [Bacteroides fragilis str. 3719 T6]